MRLFRSIFHPTSFSGARDAFAHALRFAVAAHGELRLLHVNAPNEPPDFQPFPDIRGTLARWGLLAPDAAQDAVSAMLGVRVSKTLAWDANPLAALSELLSAEAFDLIVLGIADRAEAGAFLHYSAAEAIAHAARAPTLCVRRHGGGFVSEETGRVDLQTVLVPVSGTVAGARALGAAISMSELLGATETEIHVLHVGASMPDLPEFYAPKVKLRFHLARGRVLENILEAQTRLSADLVCLPVSPRHSVAATMLGSMAEWVMRRATCPTLLVPGGGA